MDTRKLRQIKEAIRLVDERAREAVMAANEDRSKAYQLLQCWSEKDPVLRDALTAVGLLLSMKEDLVNQGKFDRASSIETLIEIGQGAGTVSDDTMPSLKMSGVLKLTSAR